MPVDQLAVADQPTGSRCLQRTHSAAVRALTYDPVGQPAGDLPNFYFLLNLKKKSVDILRFNIREYRENLKKKSYRKIVSFKQF